MPRAPSGLGRRPAAHSYLRFVAASFAFEVCFDLGHYWTHRLAHACARRRSGVAKALFNAHAAHHAHASGLAPVLAYAQAPLDVVVCNAVPALAALAATGRLLDSVTLVWAYKAYVEAAGHAGCESRATSFPQCVWLPRYLGIALRTADHDAHHGAAAVNFAKRFASTAVWYLRVEPTRPAAPNPPPWGSAEKELHAARRRRRHCSNTTDVCKNRLHTRRPHPGDSGSAPALPKEQITRKRHVSGDAPEPPGE